MKPHIEVFYIDKNNGWAAALFNENGDQTEPAMYAYRRIDVIRNSTDEWEDVCNEMLIYGKDGELKLRFDLHDERRNDER